MSSTAERVCVGCGNTEDKARLDRCGICFRYFCTDCAVRAIGGRRFCSDACSRSYYFHGETDDDEDDTLDE